MQDPDPPPAGREEDIVKEHGRDPQIVRPSTPDSRGARGPGHLYPGLAASVRQRAGPASRPGPRRQAAGRSLTTASAERRSAREMTASIASHTCDTSGSSSGPPQPPESNSASTATARRADALASRGYLRALSLSASRCALRRTARPRSPAPRPERRAGPPGTSRAIGRSQAGARTPPSCDPRAAGPLASGPRHPGRTRAQGPPGMVPPRTGRTPPPHHPPGTQPA